MKRLFVMLGSVLSLYAGAADPADLLPPEQAFKPSVTKKDDRTLVVHVEVADGYYLYRDRMQFSLQPGDGKLSPSFPEGKVKHDEYFGEVVTYRHAVDVPLASDTPIAAGNKLKLVTQGCADAGVCYPPQTVQLTLGAAPANAAVASLFGSAPATTAAQPAKTATPAKAVDAVTAPPAKATAPVPAAATAAAPAPTSEHSATDSKAGTPSETPAPASAAAASQPAPADSSLAAAAPAASEADSAEGTAKLFRSGNLAALLAFFFIAGLGLAFTACMYPLIPIVSGIVVGQGQASSKGRGFALSFVYVQGMALTYAIAGVAAALSGSLLSAALQNAWVLGGFAVFFVVMALSMFDLYELQLPSALQSRLNDASNRLPGGRWLPVFLMGALSALIVGPCVAPPLAGALAYIGASGDVLRGALALYVMALGIGAPLIVV
uniref:protein-disulfide reductase DsbD n=1 Tax=Chitinimonas sp. TaxID=1934313 RepID=UPI0035AF7F19